MSESEAAISFAADQQPWPERHLETIARALANGLDVEFRFTREDVTPYFRLRGYRGVIHILGADFGHLATMASIPAAMVRGWEMGGWHG